MLERHYAFETDASILLLGKGEVQVEDKAAPDQCEKNRSTNNDCYNPHQLAPTSEKGAAMRGAPDVCDQRGALDSNLATGEGSVRRSDNWVDLSRTSPNLRLCLISSRTRNVQMPISLSVPLSITGQSASSDLPEKLT